MGNGQGGAGSAGATVDGVAGGVSSTDFGGGGGGAGRIRVNSTSGAAIVTGVVSPSLTTACATQGMIAP
jgi:hypothetical protein